MVSLAFQATEDDVYYALTTNGVSVSLDECEALVGLLDPASVEKAALYGNTLEQQTEYAHQEIWRQLCAHPSAPKARIA